jgi:cytochrome P450
MNAVQSTIASLRTPKSLSRLPGSDSVDELWHLLRDPRAFFHDRFERYGRVFKSRLVVPCVFVVGEAANRTVLITRRAELSQGLGYARTAVKMVFENSLMLQDGDDHLRMRGLLAPAVSRLSVRESAQRVHEIWQDALARAAQEPSADVYELAERATFAVAANALIGLELGPGTDAFRPHFERLIAGVMAPVNVRVPFTALDRALDARETLVSMLAEPIEAARRRPPSGLVGQLAHHRNEDGSQLPTDEIAHHLLLLAWAGYDTTASASSWVLHVLARRPDLQERLRRELEVLADDFGELDAHGAFPETEAFLLEIERMYPSALFFPRVTLADVTIEGQVVPEGTLVFYTPYMSHRDPGSFRHPNAFDPSRWAPNAEPRLSPAKLFGFGGGPRVCLGKAFARLQLKLMTRLLGGYDIEPDPTCRHKVLGLPVHHPTGSRVKLSKRPC